MTVGMVMRMVTGLLCLFDNRYTILPAFKSIRSNSSPPGAVKGSACRRLTNGIAPV